MIETIDDLIEFLMRYHRHWLETPGLESSLVPADLPSGLAKLYRDLGALIAINPGPFNGQDTLAPVDGLEYVAGMVDFAYENQGNWSCRCPLNEMDPPVYCDKDAEGVYKVVCASSNHFLITLCLQEAVLGSPHLIVPTHGYAKHNLLEQPTPLWLQGCYVNSNLDFYAAQNSETLIMEFGSGSLWIGGHHENINKLLISGTEYHVLNPRSSVEVFRIA